MTYQEVVDRLSRQPSVENSTMMKTPCLRYKGEFMAMMFEKEDSLIIKVSPKRVQSLIADGTGNEFNYTGKPFKEWVLIPQEFDEQYEALIEESLAYAQTKAEKKAKSKNRK